MAFVNNFLAVREAFTEVLAFQKQVVLLVARFGVPIGRLAHRNGGGVSGAA